MVKKKTQSNYTLRLLHYVIARRRFSVEAISCRNGDCFGKERLAVTPYFLGSEYPCRVRVCLM